MNFLPRDAPGLIALSLSLNAPAEGPGARAVKAA